MTNDDLPAQVWSSPFSTTYAICINLFPSGVRFLHIVYFFINVSDKVNKSAAWTLTSNLLMNQDRHDLIYALTR